EGLVGQVEILVALEMLGDRRGDLPAADGAEWLALADKVADLRVLLDDLTGERSEDPRDAVLVELHLPRDDERARETLLADRVDLHVRQPRGVEHDDTRRSRRRIGRLDGSGRVGGRVGAAACRARDRNERSAD